MTSVVYVLNTFSLDKSTTQFSSTPIQVPPFQVQGATTGISPSTAANKTATLLTHTDTSNKETPLYSTIPSEYVSEQISTKNIIYDYCTGTTLTDIADGSNPAPIYEFSFAALHNNDLETSSDAKIEYILSLIFTKGIDIFHIQIPLLVASVQPADVNPFIRSWLDPSFETKDSFSINQLLNYKDTSTVIFDRFVFKINYNQSSTDTLAKTTGITKFIGNYTLCLAKTPQKILNYTGLTKNALQSFNSIFNFMMQNSMHIANPRYPLQVSKDIYLLANTGAKYPSSTTYKIASRDLAKVTTEGFADSCRAGSTGRMLNDVKCYPIDLVTQVDTNGAIMIDETTARPMDVRSFDQSTKPQPIVVDTTSGNKNSILFWLTLALFIFVIIILAIFLYFFLKSSDTVAPLAPGGASPAAAAAAGAGGAGGGLAVAAPLVGAAALTAAAPLAPGMASPVALAPGGASPVTLAPGGASPVTLAPGGVSAAARAAARPVAPRPRYSPQQLARNPALAAVLQAQEQLADQQAAFNQRRAGVRAALLTP